MKRNHDSYGGFQPLELKRSNAFYSTQDYNLLKYNSAKVGLDILIKRNNIKKMYVPFYLCPNVCREIEHHNLRVVYYSVDEELLPILENAEINDWVYIVDYFGVMDNRMDDFIQKNNEYHYIVDNCHSFFHKPNVGENYIYSCRKFFGVPDGSYLITEECVGEQKELTEGADYAGYLLTSLESGTNACYQEKKRVDAYLGEHYEAMSKLTNSIMHSIDYQYISDRRQCNAEVYDKEFCDVNKIKMEKGSIPYMYPLNFGKNIKRELIERRIFVPTLWAHCSDERYKGTREYDLTDNTLFLPVDQRYDAEDIKYIVSVVKSLM